MPLNFLAHPLTKGLSPDDPRTTALRRRIVREKPFLRKIYKEWYGHLLAALPVTDSCPGEVLELGSGGGFFKEILPEAITSEVFLTPGVDVLLDGRHLPFADSSLRGIILVDVLHHIPDVGLFFAESERVLRPGGVITMIEPWNTLWSRLIYRNLHSEPFLPDAADWTLKACTGAGPLSRANGAIPWIAFERDRGRFERSFPLLEITSVQLDYPFSYLVSGGVSMRALSPGWCFRAWRGLEFLLRPFMPTLAMFACITITRRASS